MCTSCGCNQPDIDHHTMRSHSHMTMHVNIEADLLAENAAFANDNRKLFAEQNIVTFNIVASPGAGKTTILESTAKLFENDSKFSVIVGDQATENDANRLKKQGVHAIQIFTNKVCHLDAHMITHALEQIDLSSQDFLFIENVGNLICPALFDLGENHRIVLLSVTEGEDKPLKYPYMFGSAELVVVTKIDLLPYLNFDLNACLENIKSVNPKAIILKVSATQGAGMASWIEWLKIKKITDHATN